MASPDASLSGYTLFLFLVVVVVFFLFFFVFFGGEGGGGVNVFFPNECQVIERNTTKVFLKNTKFGPTCILLIFGYGNLIFKIFPYLQPCISEIFAFQLL